ncbi:MAG: hypothetical protein ACRD38_06905 [Nitrososphaerales archaeon]
MKQYKSGKLELVNLRKLLTIIAIVALILPIALAVQADAQSSKADLKVWLKVVNTKTGIERVTEWKLGAYQFEENIPIDVPAFKVAKIKKIFDSDSFAFTFQDKVRKGSWLHFDVELSGAPVIGEVLTIRFV